MPLLLKTQGRYPHSLVRNEQNSYRSGADWKTPWQMTTMGTDGGTLGASDSSRLSPFDDEDVASVRSDGGSIHMRCTNSPSGSSTCCNARRAPPHTPHQADVRCLLRSDESPPMCQTLLTSRMRPLRCWFRQLRYR